MLNRIIKIFSIIFIIIVILFVSIHVYFSPTPNFMRNNSINGVKISIQVSNDDRKPIVRTFKKSEYENMPENKIMRVKDKIDGRIEGDITSIHLNKDSKIYFTFEKDGKIYYPETPKIRINAHASSYKDKNKKRIIEGELDRLDDGTYFYETKRYSTQYEKYFMEYLIVEIYYTIDDVDYVSIFGTFQNNANDGTDFFDNEYLEEPIPPETK
ncbi:hypothetical protein [Peptoniphilus porci]|uniref:Uncharacterized protein n=1 Tax=Peptoniphilus porci TaxID=2652280 RepID=A0A1U7LZV7_9FIRM|nr:hypothetical protein [Peptoniphilus porci]OLR64857.1 hypothetical protein BIV18_04630 [Peptoniphilus porci]